MVPHCRNVNVLSPSSDEVTLKDELMINMKKYDPCKNCAFYNPEAEHECDMTTDIPVICSVHMKKMKEEKIEVKKI